MKRKTRFTERDEERESQAKWREREIKEKQRWRETERKEPEQLSDCSGTARCVRARLQTGLALIRALSQ